MQVIDSHTEGEPTRVIVSGGPDLGSGSLAERAKVLATEHKDFYRSVVAEPYGQEAMVGVMLVEPVDPTCVAGVIYFDAAAVIGMCGHGTIGVAATLAHMGKIGMGTHKIETPVGVVEVTLSDTNTVTVKNVASHRLHKDVSLEIEGIGTVSGDVAYGGNWFFIVDKSPVPVVPSNIRNLTDVSIKIREAIEAKQLTGTDGGIIDHIVLYGPALNKNGHSRNFVLCPDNAYDRSPCGTGSSARLACLAADKRLAPGEEIIQESTIGSSYRLSYQQVTNDSIIPNITGQAFVTKEATLMMNPNDPLKNGISLS
ncbi:MULTISPECIES: proline racemase family protein [Marinomonas]|uniref:Proline racemase family protein n=1 Tax=Marinomonas arctica TaxID=383750 RepID=A0A7H1J6M1_9GAMM|nr:MULTISPECIES: proline racemase family protein [Marinomonas]MCS7485113.1 hydroxyproline-2-epimerase [Marinomonas sp. BSi20414]QNT06137.1 proline racemase family protein [Marinomonas arctica]GGN18504.1 4-hydroxyproline 2-epimerase [Marinomonas arctica]